MWPRFFERRVRVWIAREFGQECAYGPLAAASVNAAIRETVS